MYIGFGVMRKWQTHYKIRVIEISLIKFDRMTDNF